MTIQFVRQSYTFRDCRGHLGKVAFWLYYDVAVAGSIASAESQAASMASTLGSLTNAALYRAAGVYNQQNDPELYGAASDYANAETKLRIRYRGTDGTSHSAELPAPLVSNFLADKQTAKGSAIAPVIALLTATPVTSAAFVTPTGVAITESVGGTLIRRKFQRKLTKYQKSANLDEPEM